jgi:hypothetical protein
MTYEHGDLKVGSQCEYCNQLIEKDYDGDDDHWFCDYRTSHCQGDQCTPHEPYYCSHCMSDDCLKDGKSVNNFDPFVKEQYFTTDASMAEHTYEHEMDDVNAGMYPASGMDYGEIEETDPMILKLLKHGTLTEKGNPRKRR